MALLKEDLIVLAQGDTEYNGRHIFKAMDPFLPLTALATNVEHAASMLVSTD
jgi:hypothetical protein